MAERATNVPHLLRVLVVEDNRDAADSLALLIRMWGHEARVAYDGVEGLRLADEYAPDCLILDIGLPKLDGYRLARHLRQIEALREAKLVALTAYSDEQHVNRALEAGFDYQFVKPGDPDAIRRLLAMLDKVLQMTAKTENLAQQTVNLTKETKNLLHDVKQEMQAVKEEIQEVKEELREVKNDIQEVRHDNHEIKSS